jgi:hypothetical protein
VGAPTAGNHGSFFGFSRSRLLVDARLFWLEEDRLTGTIEDVAQVAGNSRAKMLFSNLENVCENSPMQIPSLSISQAKPDEPCF